LNSNFGTYSGTYSLIFLQQIQNSNYFQYLSINHFPVQMPSCIWNFILFLRFTLNQIVQGRVKYKTIFYRKIAWCKWNWHQSIFRQYAASILDSVLLSRCPAVTTMTALWPVCVQLKTQFGQPEGHIGQPAIQLGRPA
jgi:hypothetical protein